MKIWVLNKRISIAIIACCVLLISFLAAGKNVSIAVSGKQKDLPIYCVDKGDEKIMSISFDAAWGNGRYGLLI